MARWWREVLVCIGVAALAGVLWLPSIGWGLPSRESDRALFGDRTPWTGAQIIALTTPKDEGGRMKDEGAQQDTSADSSLILPPSSLPESRGADVDADPILDRSRPIVLNDTDAKRAEIVRRYRLMSGQPDEFIQFKALAEMSQRPGLSKLDPRLYQYGGLWIYPVGALVRTAMAVGLIERPTAGVPALEFYLDHPEAFGRFYVVARAYSAFWGFVALAAIYVLARRASGGFGLAALACVLFMTLPVVRTATHEAKPHLAGAALCLWAVVAAARFAETGRRRWLMIAGALCGAAMAMVVSMLLSLVVLPAAWWMRRKRVTQRVDPLPRTRGRGQGEGGESSLVEDDERSRVTRPSPQPSPTSTRERGPEVVALIASVLCAGVVYALANPFVLFNAIAHRELLRSNLGNSTAMYGVGGIAASIVSALRVTERSVGELFCVFVYVALITLATVFVLPVYRKRLSRARTPAVRLACVLGITFALLFVALAAGKPAEYGRFAIVAFAVGCIGLAGFASVVPRIGPPFVGTIAALVVLGLLGGPTLPGRASYAPDNVVLTWPDGRPNFSAYVDDLNILHAPTGLRVGLLHEPAPWSMPPIDLFHCQLLLVKPEPDQLRQIDMLIWPANLDAEVARWRVTMDSVDWRESRFLDLEADRTNPGSEWRRLR